MYADDILAAIKPHHLRLGPQLLGDACALMYDRAASALKYSAPEHFDDPAWFRSKLGTLGHSLWGALIRFKPDSFERVNEALGLKAHLEDEFGAFLHGVPADSWSSDPVRQGVELFGRSYPALWHEHGSEHAEDLLRVRSIVQEGREQLGITCWNRVLEREAGSRIVKAPLVQLSLTNLAMQTDDRPLYVYAMAQGDRTGAIGPGRMKFVKTSVCKETRFILCEAGFDYALESQIRRIREAVGRDFKIIQFDAHGNQYAISLRLAVPTTGGPVRQAGSFLDKNNYGRLRSILMHVEAGGEAGVGSCSVGMGGEGADNFLTRCHREAPKITVSGPMCQGGIIRWSKTKRANGTHFSYGVPPDKILVLGPKQTIS